ncbi:MAG: 2-polyprenyl-3-methyl-6-methoxy-1,4-benzoquinone monooxygenase [Steroidobacteraceae bacterium]
MSGARSLADQLVIAASRALRAVSAPALASRPMPSPAAANPSTPLSDIEQRLAAGLMRVNHAGEIAAQGLYHGQSLVARDPAIRDLLEHSAREETDHLGWCEQRLRELGARPSVLDPLWYAGSFAIGVAAGLASDRVSLGFVAETERQVEQHLDSHLEALPAEDLRSRAIVQQMRSDERAHGELARQAGGVALPTPVRKVMQLTARVMTNTARWI